MKRPTMLVEAILHQAEMDLDLSVERDIVVIRRRIKHEGLSFLTITLPGLSDALERGLESGLLTCPSSFSRHGRLPRFLGGFFRRVFDLDGRLRDDSCPHVVSYIRQVCRFFKKLKMPCSDARNKAAMQHFVDVESELRHMTSSIERKDVILDKISGIIWSQVFPETDYLNLVCHHGPGFTADRLSSNGRHSILKWNQRSEYTFPSDLHCYPNYGLASEVSGIGKNVGQNLGVKYLKLKDEESVRVVFVPKTQTTPRVIAIEPSHMQYMQQSVKDLAYEAIETHALTRNSIRFTDQSPNQKLAYQGSVDKRTSTLDLKDASDRVHLHLVQRIFKNSGLLEYLEDARTAHATLPDGRNIVLFKYASMGSALCFPVEAMVFYTLIQTAMHQLDGIRPSSRSIMRFSKKIAVYGDDIVVPVEYTDVVVRYLESYALKVNVSKSFSKGNFRESCGSDFYKGIPVNPIYARMKPEDNSRDWGPEHVMSWIATADLFYMRGQWIVAQAIRDMVRHTVKRPIPKTRKLGSGVAFFSYLFTTDLRWNSELQCWKQKRLHYDPAKKKDSIDGNEIACLNKWGYYQYSRSGRVRLSSLRSDRPGSSVSERMERDGRNRSYGLASDLGGHSSTIGFRKELSQLQEENVSGRELYPSETYLSVIDSSDLTIVGEVCQLKFNFSRDYCLTEVKSDPLAHLHGDVHGLDFNSSTKRGSFKSKCRWVSLAG